MGEKSQSLLEIALQLPEVIRFGEKLKKGGALSLSGVSPPAKPFAMIVAALVSGRPLCVLASSVKQQDLFYSEIAAFSAPLQKVGKSLVLHFLPESDSLAVSGTPDLEVASEVLSTLLFLQKSVSLPDVLKVVVATKTGAFQPLPSPASLEKTTRRISVGETVDMEKMTADLASMGYESLASPATTLSTRGQFVKRGGILDFFPFQSEDPVRLEFDGDRVESIRFFDLVKETSLRSVSETEWMGLNFSQRERDAARLEDYLRGEFLVWEEGEAVKIQNSEFRTENLEAEEICWEIFGHDFLSSGATDVVLQEQRRSLLERHLRDWVKEGFQIHIFCNNEGEEKRLKELIFHPSSLIPHPSLFWCRGELLNGFVWPEAKLAVLSDAQIFGRYQNLSLGRSRRKGRLGANREPLDFTQFTDGEVVVHAQHGIGRFMGIREVEVSGRIQEVLTLEYAHGALLHVPIEQAYLVGRYIGVGKSAVRLDDLGSSRWAKATAGAQRAVVDYAAQLLRVQAEREHHRGFAFQPDHAWQNEFEEAFIYEETTDQLRAIEETKQDMETPRPMDRLICGDVGFGKTEVAIRAAFKAVMNGKQAAILAPTTVLAQQHDRTFRERMADYPVRIDLLSRFRSKKEQRQTLQALKNGGVDIVIGTHRLLQPDVVFKDLGLVVVDEEQRFGVKHKERFKEKFKLVDMLTLSATPIPRTLYLALVGARDMSQIETPPVNRLPVETRIAPYDERLIRTAIQREVSRGGQVFFLHNRIHSIARVRDRLRELLPEIRAEFAHGRMEEEELEEVMMRFVGGEIDVLISTTIIESGLDIPRANTIIVDRADRFGLADLYQLRGRVGRSQTKAFALLLLPRHLMIGDKGGGTEDGGRKTVEREEGGRENNARTSARKRVSAIRQYSQLGAGFKVAMRDLEIRGAGNILGTEQSGHATAIGFELYCQLLKQTVARLKGEKPPPRIETRVRLDFLPVSEDHSQNGVGAYIPRNYVGETRLRIWAYRRMAEASDKKELRALENELCDRFGKLPLPVKLLFDLNRVRLAAARAGIFGVEVEEEKVMLKKRGGMILKDGRLPRLSSKESGARIKELLAIIGKQGGSNKGNLDLPTGFQ